MITIRALEFKVCLLFSSENKEILTLEVATIIIDIKLGKCSQRRPSNTDPPRHHVHLTHRDFAIYVVFDLGD